jgi:hypothetical protein
MSTETFINEHPNYCLLDISSTLLFRPTTNSIINFFLLSARLPAKDERIASDTLSKNYKAAA